MEMSDISDRISGHGVSLKSLYRESHVVVDERVYQMDDLSVAVPEVKPKPSFKVFVMAGAAAGIMEHCLMYPVDCVKTRMQSLRPNPNAVYKNVFDAFKKIIIQEGLFTPLRGMNIVAAGAGPAHALYFGSYEVAKKSLGKLLPSRQGQSSLAIGPAGVLATVFHDGAMNPIEVVKQRMQMYGSPYRGVVDCARTILKEEGIQAFYRSYTTQLTMNIPFQSLHFLTYEFMKERIGVETNHYCLKTHLISGATAGAVAAALTTPLDVAKTLLNTQERSAIAAEFHTNQTRTFIRGIYGALRTIYHLQGVQGYFKGLTARVIYQVPSCAICWSVYEFFKHFLTLTPEEEKEWMESAI